MKPEKLKSDVLGKYLQKKKTATMEELKKALGTNTRMSVLRKLKELGYRSSYSHSGRYYTLEKICEFDDQGLWEARDAWFSAYGTLIQTGRAFIDKSQAGYCVGELDDILHVSTKEVLALLYKRKIVQRKKFAGVYVYISADPTIKRKQLAERTSLDESERLGSEFVGDEESLHELKAAIILFFSILDEKQRRLYAGLESLKRGRGGDIKIAELLGVDPHTVAKGRDELLQRDVDVDSIRKKGAGRKSVEKKHRKS
jgi:hypothetical protein